MARRTRAGSFVVVVSLAIVAVLSLGAGTLATPPSGGTAHAHEHALTAPALAGTGIGPAVVSPAGINWQLVGPYNGKLFNASSGLPSGDANYALSVAIDPNTGVAYAANAFAGTVTAFSLGHGTVLHAVQLANPLQDSSLTGIVLDTVDHSLFVMVRYSTGDGWIRVLNEPNLAPIGNITFGSYTPGSFVPMYGTYDPGTDQVFVESNLGDVVVLNGATHAVVATLDCPVASCASRGITDVPELKVLAVPTNTSDLVVYNVSSPFNETTIAGPAGAETAFAAYDTVSSLLFVDDYATHGMGSFLLFDLTTHSYVSSPTAPDQLSPALVTDLAYDPGSNSLLVTDTVNTTEIWQYNASSYAMTSHYSAGAVSASVPRTFYSMTLDPTNDEVLATGTYFNSTIAFTLPHLAAVVINGHTGYSSFPLIQDLIGSDPGAGLFYTEGVDPTMIASYNLATRALGWLDYLPATFPLVTVNRTAIDTKTGVIYFAESDFNRTVVAIDAYTGALGTALVLGPLAGSPTAVAINSAGTLLYEASLGRIAAFNVTNVTQVQSMTTPGVAGCEITTNTTGVAYFVNCATPGSLNWYNGTTNTLGPGWTSPNLNDPVDVAVSSTSSSVYVAAAGAKNLVVVNPSSATLNASLSLAPAVPETASVDTTDQLLFVSAWHNLTLDVATTSGTPAFLAPPVPEPSPVNHTTFYAASDELLGAEAITGEIFSLTPVTVPDAPGTPGLTAGNGTLTAAWTAPYSGNAPISNYTVSLGPGASGPYTQNVSVVGYNYTFTGLANGNTYHVTVLATNPAGDGPTASPAATGVPVTVPYPPSPPTLVSRTNNSITVTWAPNANDGGTSVSGYEVRWTAAGSSTPTTKQVAGFPYNITSLTSNTSYAIQVAATNSAGTGHFGANATLATEATPPSPTPTPTPPSSSSGSSGPLGLSWEEWLGIGAIIAGVLIIALVALWSRRRKPATAAAPMVPPPSQGLPPPAPAPGGAPPAPWDEGPDELATDS